MEVFEERMYFSYQDCFYDLASGPTGRSIH